ncbi:MAG: hypothetical protein U0452_04255 [Anaerolineae bacterium]
MAERLDSVPEGLWPAWSDERVDAIVPLAPVGLPFSADGLQGVIVPALLMVGSSDTYVEPDFNVLRVYQELPGEQKALAVLDGASHHVFRDQCKDTQWLADMGFFYACSDFVWDMDRAHDLINHFTTAFLLSTLKGDADATAALSTDAVSFPGIEYQAEGF